MKLVAKIILIGDGSVGKTALRERFLGRGFNPNYLMTIGADFGVHTLELEVEGEQHQIKSSIWDLAGQPNFRNIRSLYYKGTHAVFLVYDVMRRSSFEHCTDWLAEVSKHQLLENIPLVLVGNKVDLRKEDSTPVTVSSEEGEKKAQWLRENIVVNGGVVFVETSAKTGENVEEAFYKLGELFIRKKLAKK